MNEASGPGFAGHYRMGRSRWIKIVVAETADEAWRRLPDAAPAGNRDLCVTPAGIDPNVRTQRHPAPVLPGIGGRE